MSLGDPNPSPERDPKNAGASPRRPQLIVRELDPIAVEVPLDNRDRLTDLLHLCGVTPNEDTTVYIWKTVLRNKLATIEDIHEHLGALGVSLELDVKTRHELECRSDLEPKEGGYQERVSVTLSTRHREGSELGSLLNLSEGHPALEGLFLELQAEEGSDSPPRAHIFWDVDGLVETTPYERWELLRGFYNYFTSTDLPECVPLSSGQQENFHYLLIDLAPMTVRVQRISSHGEHVTSSPGQSRAQSSSDNVFELRLEQPHLSILERIIATTGALEFEGPWATATSRREIIQHLLKRLHTHTKLDIDTLKMCAGAHPCVIFSCETSCDGEVFPPEITSRVTVTDYTCRAGEFHLEFRVKNDQSKIEVLCRWHNDHPRFSQIPWDRVQRLAQPYLRLESSEE